MLRWKVYNSRSQVGLPDFFFFMSLHLVKRGGWAGKEGIYSENSSRFGGFLIRRSAD